MYNKGIEDIIWIFFGVILALILIAVVFIGVTRGNFIGQYFSSLKISCGPYIDKPMNNVCNKGQDCICIVQTCDSFLNEGHLWLFDAASTVPISSPTFRGGRGTFSGAFLSAPSYKVVATCGLFTCDPNNFASCIPPVQQKYGETMIEVVG